MQTKAEAYDAKSTSGVSFLTGGLVAMALLIAVGSLTATSTSMTRGADAFVFAGNADYGQDLSTIICAREYARCVEQRDVLNAFKLTETLESLTDQTPDEGAAAQKGGGVEPNSLPGVADRLANALGLNQPITLSDLDVDAAMTTSSFKITTISRSLALADEQAVALAPEHSPLGA
jgi:hypothetical protein